MTGQSLDIFKTMKNILIIQLGDIGDVVWSIPTFWAIKESIPKVKTAVIVKEGFGELLRMEPSIDEIFEVKKSKKGFFSSLSSQIQLFRKIRSREFDMAVDLRSGDRGAFLAFLSGATRRVTHHYDDVPFWRNLLFTDVVYPPSDQDTRGAAEQSLCIIRELGIDTANKIPRLIVPESIIQRSQAILTDAGLTENTWITINTFSRWSYKELPLEKWIALLDWIEKTYKMKMVLIGSPDERKKAEKLQDKCKGHLINVVGKTTLAELAGVLYLSRLHIGVDSAAPHIAAAVDTPTISIYGPSNWKDWAPIGEQHRVILSDLDCVPCRQKGCYGTERSRCLEELDVEKIKFTVQEMLNSSKKGK